ncbi:MAG: DUF3859 domain-containing protein [Verrucomicrobia bacterium]|nr:DUF3859 domain-containing protein [Verrucomicrobiota bacterium]
MPRKRLQVEMASYGIFTPWNSKSKSLPEIIKFTDEIPARLGIEFGYILNIKGGRGEKLTFRMEHPPFRGDDGEISPPFTGEMHIRNNDFHFFLGDTVWEPAEDKVGEWRLITYHDNKVIADKTFRLISPTHPQE